MTDPTQVRADLIPYAPEYAAVVRSWIDSEQTLFDLCRGRDYPPSDDIVETWQREEIAAYLLFANRKPVAYGELWPLPNERAVEIAHLLVDPIRRQHGYGAKILQLLFERGSERRFVSKVLLNLYSANEAALGCFMKAGFELLATTGHTAGLKMVRLVKK